MQDALVQALVIWCERQRRSHARQLALMESRAMWTFEYREGQPEDTTKESILEAKRVLEELDMLLAKYGLEIEGEDDLTPP